MNLQMSAGVKSKLEKIDSSITQGTIACFKWGKIVEDRLHEDTYKLVNELQERLSQVDQV
jgi:hypothetical protein